MVKVISYSQNFEDVILWRALSHIQGGCYVDIGAQSPDTDSVSRLFYDNGWRGVHAEPMPQYAGLLRASRPDETVLQVAVDERPGIIQFYSVKDTGLSTTDPAIAKQHRGAGFDVEEIRVPAVTLDTVLEQASGGVVHWLKIDVEGAEHRVINGWTGSGPKPWVLVIESTRPLSAEQSHELWEPAVLARGYSFVYFDGLNRFYVSDAHHELAAAFGAGPNVFDDFSLSPSSQFCALVNINYHALETEHAKLRRQFDACSSESEARRAENAALTASAEASRREAHKWWSAHEDLQTQMQARAGEIDRLRVEMAGLHSQSDAAKQEAQRWWLAHEALTERLDALLKGADNERQAAHADRERLRSEILLLAERVEAASSEVEDWRNAYEEANAKLALATDMFASKEAEYEKSIDAMIESQRRTATEHAIELARAGDRSRHEFAELAAQVDVGKHEAHRWWLAHEALRSHLDAVERSRSWRWTRFMRSASQRVAEAQVAMKQLVLPLATRAIRSIFARPRLHRTLKPVVARLPFVYSRLHALALREEIYSGHVRAQVEGEVSPAAFKGNEREYAVVHLDKRAKRVLAALKDSRTEKATR